MNLPHLASRLYGTPLLLARSKLDIILAVLGSRVGWPTAAELALPPSRASPVTPPTAATGIAVIPVHSSLVRRAFAVDAASGLTSYGEIAAMLDAAVADPAVSGILLDIDSPGGEAGGVFELAQHIRAIDAIKPVWALACDSAYSAAYAIACAASRVFVTQTGGVGSIGVIAMHVDQSLRDAQEGYRFTAVSAGDFKNDLSPHEPIDKGAMARLQTEVDRLYGLFVDHVAAMRGIEAKVIRDTQAALFFGPDAISSGLADAVASSEQVISAFAAYLGAGSVAGTPVRLLSASAMDTESSSPTFFEATTKEIHMNPDAQANPAQPVLEPESATTVDEAKQTTDLPLPDVPTAAGSPLQGDPSPDAAALALSVAVAGARAEAITIAELCQLAGQSDRIATFLAHGVSANQVRQTLLASRAQSQEISSVIHPDAVSKTSASEPGALMAAVKKLTQKL